jgi:hypothetical protein
MRVYVTRNSEYIVTKIGELEVITTCKGINEGKLYGILGFWDKETPVEIFSMGRFMQFYSKTENQRLLGYDELSKFLDKSPKEGKKIVARLLGDDKKFAEIGTPCDLIITSSIQEIRDSPNQNP